MMNMCAVAGLASSGTALRRRLDLRKRAHQPVRAAGDRRAAGVGVELARPRDRRLNQHRGDRRQDHRREQRDRVRAMRDRRRAPPPKNIAKRDDHHDRRGQRRRDGADQDVAMLDVRELVRDHAFELVVAQDLQDAFGRGDRGVLRVAAGRKGVRRRAAESRSTAACGRPARGASRATMRYSRWSGPTSCALYIRRTILSENQYQRKLVTTANRKPIIMPCAPPSAPPTKSSSALSTPSSSAVFTRVGHIQLSAPAISSRPYLSG